MPSAHFDRIWGLWPRVLLFCVAMVAQPAPAFAWIEQVVLGHETRVDLEREGWAQVRHQLTLSLRGGPLKSLEIEGVGGDIELLSDAKVTRIKGPSGGGIPLRLIPAEGGALRLEVLGGDGLRSGTYRFDFGYRLDAAKKKLLQADGERTAFTWVGPRLQGGVDAAKVVISLPHASRPPALLESPDRAARGVLLGQVLVGSARDEIELLRTHVAVGEPAVWQVEFDRAALSGSVTEDPFEPPGLAGSRERLPRSGPSLWQVALGLFVAALVGLLVACKERSVRILSERTESRARPLVPSPLWLRVTLAASAAVGLVALTLMHRAALAMACGVALALVTVHFPPVRETRPRGPGTWIPLRPETLARPTWPLLVRLFDSSTLPGFALASALLLLGAGAAYARLPHDNFQALMILSLVLLLSPLFLTGRRTDFPRSPAEQALPWFRFLASTRQNFVSSLELWGRQTDRVLPLDSLDEIRLRVVLERPPAGLRALEVAFEEGPGSYVSPCVVLRVVEDSPARQRLPEGIAWSRGRQSEEKTAVLHPRAPTRAQLLRLLRSVLAHLERPQAPVSASRDQKVARSSGSSDSAVKRGGALSLAR